MVTVSVMEATSPPPPLGAVADAIACAVSSYCSRVGGLDEDEQATSEEPRMIQVMRFMGAGESKARSIGAVVPRRRFLERMRGDAWLASVCIRGQAWRNPTAVP